MDGIESLSHRVIWSLKNLLIVAAMLFACQCFAQMQAPVKEVKQALGCAQSEGWFSSEVAKLPRWQVASSQVAAKNNRRLELLVYDRPAHGDYLEFQVEGNDRQRAFQLTNKATFYFHQNAIVKFPEPPRGGLWALPDLVHLVQRMNRGPKTTIVAAQLAAYRQSVGCKGYNSAQASTFPSSHLR